MIQTRSESNYLKRVRQHADQVVMDHPVADQEGFEFFGSDEYLTRDPKRKPMPFNMLLSVGVKNLPFIARIFAKYMPSMMRGRNGCFDDLAPYLDELDRNGKLASVEETLQGSFPNQELWDALTDYAWQKWRVTLGFTELPEELVFRGKAVLFKYALVCVQEMDQSKIELAPKLDAGEEVQRVYNSLGLAVNDIANWLRRNYGVRCQSNHPLGGLVNTPPLAGKAGLGWQGHNGLLIVPQYGPRQRIAPIFLEHQLFEFTDSQDHRWIEEFCRTCRRCEKACPTGAIYPERRPGLQGIAGIGQTRTCIDREKCYPQFSKTLGCSICMKVCPFSKGEGAYYKIRDAYLARSKKQETNQQWS